MKISKSDILNPESENAAVKLALAETHIINETKTYLESQGVLLDSFSTITGSNHVRRSDTVILVKNIPYGTSAETIREMFEAHGELNRVLIPPAGTIAVVEFVHPDEAARAFKAMAYRRLGSTIVYLEKGPIGMFKEPTSTIAEDGPGTVVSTGIKPVTIPDEKDTADESQTSVAGGTTLFVKNLAFSTTSERLDRAFRSLPSFAFARVQMKPDPKNLGGKLSMGYGFVGFKDVEGAKRALKSMQGYVLDGHSLSIRLAGRGVEEPSEGKGKTSGKSSTKVIVKNVPFEASKKDIRELFGYVILRSIHSRSFPHKRPRTALMDN
jgi:multiple RNA-binding domain-containing protein 1